MAARSNRRTQVTIGSRKRAAKAQVSPGKSPASTLGAIENVDGGVLSGWIIHPQGSNLDVYADGNYLGMTKAAQPRSDVAKTTPVAPPFGFSFSLPAEIIDGDEHEFEVRPSTQKQHSKHQLKRKLAVPLFVDAATKVAGWIDGVIDGLLYGWHTAPTGSRLIVIVDDQYLCTTRNNVPREDVIAAGHANEPVGFELELPEKLQDGAEHVFTIRPVLADDDSESISRLLVVENRPSTKTGAKHKSIAAVVCWDLGHNPAGRALVLVQALERLYDEVHLIGPLFWRFGGKVWEPIANNPKIHIIAEKVKTFAELEAFQAKILKQKYDFVHMCKPRWPTLYLGIRLAQASDCQVALDIDDYELSFFKNAHTPPPLTGVVEKLKQDQLASIDLEATLLAHTIIDSIPTVTVSNISLQKKFGGTIIRHARDEREFDPAAFNREQIRYSYGYGANDKVILFLGTIRRHKGVVKIAEAIAKLKRRDIKLCLIGPIGEPALETEIRALLGLQVSFHKGVPFSMLASTTLLADLVCLPQEMESEVSQFQIPAKLTDALSMGIPVILENLPPFRDLAKAPGIYIRKNASLSSVISKALKTTKKQKKQIRDFFLTEFSTAASAECLSRLIRTTSANDPRKWIQEAQKIGITHQQKSLAVNHASAAISRNRGRDVVFLWKQNDSGLFGRRSDMVMRHLVKQGFAGRVLHFDASMSLDNMNRLQEQAEQKPLSANGMVHRNIVSRFLGLAHELQVSRYTILHDNKKRSFLGRALPTESEIPDVLRSIFKAERLSEEALLWTCPVIFDFEMFTAARNFPFKVVDIIDDQRSFSTNDAYKKKLSEHYSIAMASANIVFANCDGVAQRFSKLTRNPINVISNAAEKISRNDIQPIDIFSGRKDVLRIGYVGNLRDRIDIELLSKIAEENSSWQLVLVGPTGGHTAIEELSRYPNVTLLGPQRYEDSIRIAASFDVAIIPHIIGELTASMNPLKLYMYQGLGLPIVSTEVENMTGANGSVHVARTHKQFINHLKTIEKSQNRRYNSHSLPGQNVYWDENVAEMIRITSDRLKRLKLI